MKERLKNIGKKEILFVLGVLIIVGFLAYALAAIALHPLEPLTALNEDVYNLYNFSLNTTYGPDYNVTQINITLPSGFFFKYDSNATEIGQNATFTNTSSILTWTNTSSWLMNGSKNNADVAFWFNATTTNPGDYNITVIILNTTAAGKNNVTYFNISVSINDTTAPDVYIANFSTLTPGENKSGTIILNISIADNLALRKVYFNITNRSGTYQRNITYASNTSARAWNASFNTVSLADGAYNITIWANDSNSNMNKSVNIPIVIDNTAPTAIISCTPTKVYTEETVTCTCSASDATSGVDSSAISYTASPSTSSTGTFTTSCSYTDRAGNGGGIVSTTYTVEQVSSGTTGTTGGGQVTAQKTQVVTITPESEVKLSAFQEELGVEEIKITVTEKAQNVKVTVKKYDSKPAEVTVEKTGKVNKYLQIETENLGNKLSKAVLTVKVEKSWSSDNSVDKADIVVSKFDETAEKWNELSTLYKEEDDTYYYYEVQLTSFSYFAIGEKALEGGVPAGEEEGEEAPLLGGNTLWLGVVIGVIVLIAIVAMVILKKRKK